MSIAELERRYGVVIIISQCEVTTQCLVCENAYGGCRWSQDGQPIPGWDAVRNDLVDTVPIFRQIESYVVLDCPKFRLEPRWAEEYKRFSPENARRAVMARKCKREAKYADLEEMGR